MSQGKSIFTVFILFFFVNSAFSAHHMVSEQLPEAEGQALIEYVTKTNNYQNWPLWPGTNKLYEGQHPHGSFLTTYVNKLAFEAIEGRAGTLPKGSVVVKENYSSEKKLTAVTVMYKKPGFNPEAGDWFWLKFTPDSRIEKQGTVGGCIGCHRSVKTNDWLFTGPVR
ncbi:MAG: cytochrome P460 family protein [Deltaproteobacteria bacterium]|jgi:hypothetical protein|nr:cytochrome P460 family protein [Deltaproteobacteria bacterium]